MSITRQCWQGWSLTVLCILFNQNSPGTQQADNFLMRKEKSDIRFSRNKYVTILFCRF
jgi:hypothetical protein